mmetsp:Transcript_30328/g.45932  ORF Transcript_30328/g.45932 Transcript_30328/m.45932 type:complete len:89 (+) Transcript_30328:48-314(+)
MLCSHGTDFEMACKICTTHQEIPNSKCVSHGNKKIALCLCILKKSVASITMIDDGCHQPTLQAFQIDFRGQTSSAERVLMTEIFPLVS